MQVRRQVPQSKTSKGRSLLLGFLTMLSLAALPATWSAADTCSFWNPAYSYAMYDNYTRALFDDQCWEQDDSTCVDCVATIESPVDPPYDWAHCAENEEGTEGYCQIYENYSQVPAPPEGRVRHRTQ